MNRFAPLGFSSLSCDPSHNQVPTGLLDGGLCPVFTEREDFLHGYKRSSRCSLLDCCCHMLELSVLTLSLPFTEHAAVLLHRAFLVGMYGQIDTSSQISEALKVLHMEATI